jgi:hypothetical protein
MARSSWTGLFCVRRFPLSTHALAVPARVDREGHLRYSLFGAIEWNEPEVIARITALLDE